MRARDIKPGMQLTYLTEFGQIINGIAIRKPFMAYSRRYHYQLIRTTDGRTVNCCVTRLSKYVDPGW